MGAGNAISRPGWALFVGTAGDHALYRHHTVQVALGARSSVRLWTEMPGTLSAPGAVIVRRPRAAVGERPGVAAAALPRARIHARPNPRQLVRIVGAAAVGKADFTSPGPARNSCPGDTGSAGAGAQGARNSGTLSRPARVAARETPGHRSGFAVTSTALSPEPRRAIGWRCPRSSL